ncbi:MAG: protocatechuate 3,4-dioxygenase subunit beta [Paracoccaceae bacterium]|nr:protocatechuate 3,4-dioxygenase subunit beta [Paracoccaceae bacterium]
MSDAGFVRRDPASHPPALAPDYRSTRLRAPARPLLTIPQTLSEITGPAFGHEAIGPLDHDLLQNASVDGAPIGARIIVHGRVLDGDGRPVPETLVEVWQANAAGRYRHANDGYQAPLDRNFSGLGRALTDADGSYRFLTVMPGAYPWPNGPNSWRPAHIHFSVFGAAFCQRLITQMYFEGDPLIRLCPIVQSVADPDAVARLIAPLDMDQAQPFDALAYRFDIVLRGRAQTPMENRPEGA